MGKGQVVLDEVTKRVAAIEKDDKIPVRGKKGVLSKKQTRDEVRPTQTLLTAGAEEGGRVAEGDLARVRLYEREMVSWHLSEVADGRMTFPRTESVDGVWAKVARSVAYGPLRDAGVSTAKVATLDPGAGDMGTHVVIIYVDNIYDKEKATKVLVSLLEDHGIEPSASKSDLYTTLGIDSKHASGMRSSIWRPAELVKDSKVSYRKFVDS